MLPFNVDPLFQLDILSENKVRNAKMVWQNIVRENNKLQIGPKGPLSIDNHLATTNPNIIYAILPAFVYPSSIDF